MIAMKTIQITMDEKLLAKLDADEETLRDGRSAVLRRAVADYLNRRRRTTISSAYRKAYSKKTDLAGFEHWEDEGVWPRE
jgi:metal-responsive CopG/Arc/MetJ family transcriptional regulator